MVVYSEYVRSRAAYLELNDLLREPVTQLLGVSAAAGQALAQIGVVRIFDLGASSVLAPARSAATAGHGGEIAARYGLTPQDWLEAGTIFQTLEDIANPPLKSLRTLTPTQASALKEAVDVTTVGEFANWPPQAIARQKLANISGGHSS